MRNFEWLSGMREFTLKNDLDYYRDRMHVTMGVGADMHFYNPGQIEPLSGSVMHEMKMTKKRALQLSAYVGNEHKITDRLTLSYGLRMSSSIQLGPTTVRQCHFIPTQQSMAKAKLLSRIGEQNHDWLQVIRSTRMQL